MWHVAEIAAKVGGEVRAGDGSVSVCGASVDGRCVRTEEAFVALPGAHVDGHQFVDQAFHRGASAAIVRADWAPAQPGPGPLIAVDDPLLALQRWATAHLQKLGSRVAAVTGSNGKTTTKDLSAAALGGAPRIGGSLGNYNNQIGLPISILAMDRNVEIAVLEMGMSSPGEIARLVEIAPPEIAAITNIGPAHLESMGDLNAIAQAKLEILSQNPHTLILPQDSHHLREGARERLRAGIEVRTFGFEPGADLRAEAVRIQSDGTTQFLARDRGALQLPLPGAHNVLNALVAIAIAEHFGRDWAAIKAALEKVHPAPMRSERLQIGGVWLINDTYNANPASMIAAVRALVAQPTPGRRILVLGDMLELGQHSSDYHRNLGIMIDAAGVDWLLTVGPHAEAIGQGAPQLNARGGVAHFASADRAAQHLAQLAEAGDLVLLKASRGMALETIVEDFSKRRSGKGGD